MTSSVSQVVSQYLTLGSCMKKCAQAVENFASAINDANSIEEITELLRAPVSNHSMSGMPLDLPLLSANGKVTGASSHKKRSKSDDSDDDDGEDGRGGKKGRKSKKKEKDPNAPKRPASAYLLFQNAVRNQIKERNPDVTYRELIGQVGEAWKELGDEGQKPYKDVAEKAMATWKADNAAYLLSKGIDPSEVQMDEDDAEVEEAVIAKEPPKKEKKDKKPTKEDKKPAKEAAPAKAAAVPSTTAPAAAVKDTKKGKAAAAAAAAAPSSKTATTSTPAAKNAAKPAPASAKKGQPAPPAPVSESEEDDSDDESEEESESD